MPVPVGHSAGTTQPTHLHLLAANVDGEAVFQRACLGRHDVSFGQKT